jgi:hypothetical protein
MILFIHSFPFLHHHLSQHIFVVDFILGDKKEKDGKWCNNSSKRWKDPQNLIKRELFIVSLVHVTKKKLFSPFACWSNNRTFTFLAINQHPAAEAEGVYTSLFFASCFIVYVLYYYYFFLSFFFFVCCVCSCWLKFVVMNPARKTSSSSSWSYSEKKRWLFDRSLQYLFINRWKTSFVPKDLLAWIIHDKLPKRRSYTTELR